MTSSPEHRNADRRTGERWSYPQRSRSEARRLALRMRRAGYVATYGGAETRSTLPRALRVRWCLGLLADLHRARAAAERRAAS